MKMHPQITQSLKLLKKKKKVGGKSDLFSVYEDFHREEIKSNVYGSLFLWGKASEKIHDCKPKPEKFQLEMKSNFNQENDRPLVSLKKQYWVLLTEAHCIRNKNVLLWIHSCLFPLLLMKQVPL